MSIHRLKRNFTAGEVSPILNSRTDLERFKNGCRILHNMYCTTQGPATRRPGTQFIFDLTPHISNDIIESIDDLQFRLVDFVYSENLAYALVFFKDTDLKAWMIVGHKNGVVAKPLDPTQPYKLELGTDFDVEEFDYAQMGKDLNIASRTRPPQKMVYNAGDDWTIADITFTDPPDEWSFTDLATVPTKVSFYEQRLVFASSVNYPQMFWFSKAGDFYNHGVSSPLVESDALTYMMASGEQNKVQWLVSSRSLIVGTLGDEWTISGAGAPISYKSVAALKQTNEGSEFQKPLMSGPATVFIERLGRAINEMVYDYTHDSYIISDISLLAPHLIEQYGLVNWTLQKSPYSIIWGVREDGDLIGITYQRKQKVVGWHHHDSYRGTFLDITSIPSKENREDEVWCIVARFIGGSFKIFLEKLSTEFKEDESLNAWFVDSGVRKELSSSIKYAIYKDTEDALVLRATDEQTFAEGEEVFVYGVVTEDDEINTRLRAPVTILHIVDNGDGTQDVTVHLGPMPTVPSVQILSRSNIQVNRYAKIYKGFNTMTGLGHLEGEEVDILVNGAVMPSQVVNGGEVSIPEDTYVCTVGLGFESVIKPLEADLPLNTGTTVGRTQRINNVSVMLHRSLGMEIGRDLDHLEEVPFRVPSDLTGQAVPLFSGIRKIPFPEGYEDESNIIIRQRQPLPLTVVSVTDEIEVYER